VSDRLAPESGPEPQETRKVPRLRAAYTRILVAAAVALLVWQLLPHVPHDQTVILALGAGAAKISRLEVVWEAEGQAGEGRLVLNFPAPPPERLVRQFRLANGDYEFRVAARLHSEAVQRTEVTRRVTLGGSTVTLRLEELTQ